MNDGFQNGGEKMTNNDMSQQFSVAAAYAANKHAG